MLKKLNVCFKKILTFLVSLCLFFNLTFTGYIYSYADDVASINPLFIPITQVVTATAIATGIIANSSQEAIKGADQLIQNVISNIKSSEIQKSEADSNYVSPYKVINGGKPEKPSNDNKNGKWVALGAGALASNEIWANKEAIEAIMSQINNLNGYDKTIFSNGVKNVSDTNLLTTSNASGIALQLAQYDSRLNTQFTNVINSSVFNDKISEYGINKDNLVYSVTFIPTQLAEKSENYPALTVSCIDSSTFSKIRLSYNLGFNTISGRETSTMYPYSYSYYYLTDKDGSGSLNVYRTLNDDNASVRIRNLQFQIGQHDATQQANVSLKAENYNNNVFLASMTSSNLTYNAYVGYKWTSENPWTFTNNVYNVNKTFDVNFPDWLQNSINLLGQQMEMLRLGLTTIQPSWNPTQEQIQSGLSPTNVINQYINNYENPEYIPEDNPNTGDDDDNPSVAPPIQEPQPNNDYLGNFLLPESITTKFPFCIPFDVARCLRLFSTSQREAPKWECDLKYGSNTYHVVIDLSIFDDLASFIRPLEYIAFLVGLAVGTRSLMRG